jgi:hypothetical protein
MRPAGRTIPDPERRERSPFAKLQRLVNLTKDESNMNALRSQACFGTDIAEFDRLWNTRALKQFCQRRHARDSGVFGGG